MAFLPAAQRALFPLQTPECVPSPDYGPFVPWAESGVCIMIDGIQLMASRLSSPHVAGPSAAA